jgi:hypothetical protein
MHPKVPNLKHALGSKLAPIICYTNVTQYSTHRSGSWAQLTLPLHPHLKTRTNLTYIYGGTRSSHKTTTYNKIYIHFMVKAYTHMPPCKSLLEGWLSARPCGIESLANYYNGDNCAKYLTHPPVLMMQSTSPICSSFCPLSPHQRWGRTMTVATNGFIANGGCLEGGGCWTTVIPG